MKRFSFKKVGIIASSILFAVILTTMIFPIQKVGPATIVRQFDFGTATSPLESGYTHVTKNTVYSGALGYGWTSSAGLNHLSRGGPDSLRRDFVYSSTDHTFNVNLAKVEYQVTVIIGDNYKLHDYIDVYAEGVLKVNDLTTSAGSFATRTFDVTVSDGQLNLMFSDDGGSNIYWVINAITIEEIEAKQTDCLTIPPSAFVPYTAYPTAGIDRVIRSAETISSHFYAPVQLPNGSVIRSFTAYWEDYDTSEDLTCELSRYNLISNGWYMAYVLSSGSAGFGYTVDTTINYATINNWDYFYQVHLILPPSTYIRLNCVMIEFEIPT